MNYLCLDFSITWTAAFLLWRRAPYSCESTSSWRQCWWAVLSSCTTSCSTCSPKGHSQISTNCCNLMPISGKQTKQTTCDCLPKETLQRSVFYICCSFQQSEGHSMCCQRIPVSVAILHYPSCSWQTGKRTRIYPCLQILCLPPKLPAWVCHCSGLSRAWFQTLEESPESFDKLQVVPESGVKFMVNRFHSHQLNSAWCEEPPPPGQVANLVWHWEHPPCKLKYSEQNLKFALLNMPWQLQKMSLWTLLSCSPQPRPLLSSSLVERALVAFRRTSSLLALVTCGAPSLLWSTKRWKRWARWIKCFWRTYCRRT